MRILFAIAAASCVCIPASAAAMTPLQRETALWNASKQGQIDLFAASISPGFIGVYATGTHNRAQEIRGVRARACTVSRSATFVRRASARTTR